MPMKKKRNWRVLVALADISQISAKVLKHKGAQCQC